MKRWVTTLFLLCSVLVFTPISSYPNNFLINTIQFASAASEGEQKIPQPQTLADACGSFSMWDGSILCYGIRGFFQAIFAIIIKIAGTFMAFGGKIFDLTIFLFVTNLGGYLSQSILLDAIQKVWGTVRDIGNIVLIGMFVFIAIRTILGIGGSSNKQLVINIIIVALLINFSLFFVKAALDVTNFFAYQFYKGMTTVNIQDEDGNRTERQATISERFSTLAGVSKLDGTGEGSIWSNLSGAGSRDSRDENADLWGLGELAVQSLGLTILFMATGFVFFYGAALLTIRGIMLLLLMVTSAAAFTTYVLPSPHVRKFFDQWFDALVQNALFGPLLVILLWVSMMLTSALLGAGSNKTLYDGSMLINYVVVIGLMYASIKIASSIAGKSEFGIGKFKPREIMTGFAGGLAGRGVDRLAKYRQDSARKGAFEQLNAAEKARSEAHANFKANSTQANAQTYKTADKALQDLRKKLDKKPIDMRDGNLGTLARALGAKVGKPDAKGKTLLKGAEEEQRTKKKEATEVGQLANEIHRQNSQDKEAAKKETDRLGGMITDALNKQTAAQAEGKVAEDKLVKLKEAQVSGATVTINGKEVGGSEIQTQINTQQGIIDKAQRESAEHAATVDVLKREQGFVTPESIRAAKIRDEQKKQAELEKNHGSLIKMIAEMKGYDKFSDAQVATAAKIIPMTENDVKEMNAAAKQEMRELERAEDKASNKAKAEQSEKEKAEKKAEKSESAANAAKPPTGGDHH